MSEKKWEATVFVDNTPMTNHVSYKITPQRGVYGSMFRDDAFMAAAAPELYDALEIAARFIANTESELGIELDSGILARAALAKARGEQ